MRAYLTVTEGQLYSLLLYLNCSNINVAVDPCAMGGSKLRSDLNGIVCSIKTLIGGSSKFGCILDRYVNISKSYKTYKEKLPANFSGGPSFTKRQEPSILKK